MSNAKKPEYGFLSKYLRYIETELDPVKDENPMHLFRDLVDCERKFFEWASQKSKRPQSTRIYKKFSEHIINHPNGLNLGRIYFRIRQSDIKHTLNTFIKSRDVDGLLGLCGNYKMVQFYIDNYNDHIPRYIRALVDRIVELRNQIFIKYAYFVINRAKGYLHVTKHPKVDLEDLIQVANEALLTSIDKYSTEADGGKNFKFSVVAGYRMLASFMVYSTSLHTLAFSEYDHKRIYKLRKIKQHNQDQSFDQIAKEMKISPDLVVALWEGVLEYEMFHDNNHDYDFGKASYLDNLASESTPDDRIEMLNKEIIIGTIENEVWRQLTTIEKKILVMRGVGVLVYKKELENVSG